MLFQTNTFCVFALVKNHYSTSCYLNAQLLSQSKSIEVKQANPARFTN